MESVGSAGSGGRPVLDNIAELRESAEQLLDCSPPRTPPRSPAPRRLAKPPVNSHLHRAASIAPGMKAKKYALNSSTMFRRNWTIYTSRCVFSKVSIFLTNMASIISLIDGPFWELLTKNTECYIVNRTTFKNSFTSVVIFVPMPNSISAITVAGPMNSSVESFSSDRWRFIACSNAAWEQTDFALRFRRPVLPCSLAEPS